MAGPRTFPARALPAGGFGEDAIFERLPPPCHAPRDEAGAQAAVVGRAQFGAPPRPREATLGVPLVDPVVAATAFAIGIMGLR